jgi:hypothetical protein
MSNRSLAWTWVINLAILYLVLSLLETIVNWKVWVAISIFGLILYIIILRLIEWRLRTRTHTES